MTATKYLQSIGRQEHRRLGDGKKTGEFTITPAEIEAFADQREREAWDAHGEVKLKDGTVNIYVPKYETFDDYTKRKGK